jgi:hypothetical protein
MFPLVSMALFLKFLKVCCRFSSPDHRGNLDSISVPASIQYQIRQSEIAIRNYPENQSKADVSLSTVFFFLI